MATETDLPFLLVVGEGPVADVLVPMAELLGWRARAVAALDEVTSALPDAAAVVVTSHDGDVDGPALQQALGAGVRYVGAMGSRRTQERRRTHLTEAGVGEDEQARIHGPAGLDIGADGPPEIALAILAELVSVVRGGRAGSISERPGPIHPGLAPGEAFCPPG